MKLCMYNYTYVQDICTHVCLHQIFKWTTCTSAINCTLQRYITSMTFVGDISRFEKHMYVQFISVMSSSVVTCCVFQLCIIYQLYQNTCHHYVCIYVHTYVLEVFWLYICTRYICTRSLLPCQQFFKCLDMRTPHPPS